MKNEQEKVKAEILKAIDDETKPSFISIIGSAGTGKTLLTYDVAK